MSDLIVSNPRDLRRFLGHYPTGVCAVTSLAEDQPVGMTVGSFTSVSLDPPLVAFFPDRKSSTWPKIWASKRFCVNILAQHQRGVCQALSAKEADKFARIAWRPSATGLPIIDDIVAWIECDIDAVHEAGDHYVAIARVRALGLGHPHEPLLFLRGSYGQFSPTVALS